VPTLPEIVEVQRMTYLVVPLESFETKLLPGLIPADSVCCIIIDTF